MKFLRMHFSLLDQFCSTDFWDACCNTLQQHRGTIALPALQGLGMWAGPETKHSPTNVKSVLWFHSKTLDVQLWMNHSRSRNHIPLWVWTTRRTLFLWLYSLHMIQPCVVTWVCQIMTCTARLHHWWAANLTGRVHLRLAAVRFAEMLQTVAYGNVRNFRDCWPFLLSWLITNTCLDVFMTKPSRDWKRCNLTSTRMGGTECLGGFRFLLWQL